MEVETDLVQKSHDDEAGSVSTANCGAFAAESAVRGLVRCLCGVVVGRWKQTAKARKKAWVLHAMEAVHALVRTLEVGLLLVLAWHLRRKKFLCSAGGDWRVVLGRFFCGEIWSAFVVG